MTVWMASLKAMYAIKYRRVCGSCCRCFHTAPSSERPMARYLGPGGLARFAARVLKRVNVISANPPHQIPADRSEIRTAESGLIAASTIVEANGRYTSSPESS